LRKIPGVSFAATEFTPREGLYKGQSCEGVAISLTDRAALESMLMGLTIADVLDRLYPGRFQLQKTIALLGAQSTVERLARGDDPAQIIKGWSGDLDEFRRTRAKYLLYR
jgi:uncharacterized protein YbbC (DUF1343 family)